MAVRHQPLPPDKQVLVKQFLRLSPAERLRQAFGMADFALRINPNLLRSRWGVALAKHRPRSR